MRYLKERDEARDAGDKIAAAVKAFLKGKVGEEDLCLALMEYCTSTGWNGTAGNMVKDIIDFEKEES